MAEENVLLTEPAAQQPWPNDRRAWVRYPCDLKSSCEPVPLPTASQPEWKWAAEIRDISVAGAGLVLARRFEPGTPLFIDLASRGDGTPCTLSVRVARLASLPMGGWLLGCQFDTPLSEEDLKSLLAATAPAAP